jgi:hypothetical protein
MFFKSWVEMGGFALNHHWHGINLLSLLECVLLAALLCSVLALLAVRKSKRLVMLSLFGALSFATAAYAANTALSALSASGAIAGANLVYVVQTAGAGGVKATFTQVATFINSLFSGDATVSSGGVVTLKNTGPGATGPIGSATLAPVVTIDAQGRVTALSSASITQPAAANPTATASDTAVNGSAGTFMRSDGAPAVQKATTSVFGVAKADNVGIGATAGVLSNLGATSVSGGIGVSVSPTTGTVVVSAPATVRNNTATTDTITSTDKGTIVTESNASSVAVAITTAGFVSTDYFTVKNLNAGIATYTPSSGTINGAATLVCSQNQSADLYFDGTNYKTLANTCGLGALATITPGANVATAAAVALSGAGGLTSTIASGTSALGTSAIASAACATVVTTAATNTATTDVVTASFNGDPTAVTGYIPATAGMLTIFAYPTSGNVNFKVCNNTAGSITPGAITLNWRVVR